MMGVCHFDGGADLEICSHPTMGGQVDARPRAMGCRYSLTNTEHRPSITILGSVQMKAKK